jgi:hypothetical protein
MMKQVLTTMDRGEKTNNWNIQKFHEILHLPKQISEYGNICNTDAGFGECGLKYWAKRPGQHAFKSNIDVFTESTVKRVREHVCLRKAAHIICEKESANLIFDYDSDSSSDCFMIIDHEAINPPLAQKAQPARVTTKQLTTRPKFKVYSEISTEAGENNILKIPRLCVEGWIAFRGGDDANFLQSLNSVRVHCRHLCVPYTHANCVNLVTKSKKSHVRNFTPYCTIKYGLPPFVVLRVKIVLYNFWIINPENSFGNSGMQTGELM